MHRQHVDCSFVFTGKEHNTLWQSTLGAKYHTIKKTVQSSARLAANGLAVARECSRSERGRTWWGSMEHHRNIKASTYVTERARVGP